jgi:hypothetical protein
VNLGLNLRLRITTTPRVNLGMIRLAASRIYCGVLCAVLRCVICRGLRQALRDVMCRAMCEVLCEPPRGVLNDVLRRMLRRALNRTLRQVLCSAVSRATCEVLSGVVCRTLYYKDATTSFSQRCFSPLLLSWGRQVLGNRRQEQPATAQESGPFRASIRVHLRSSVVTSGLVVASEAAPGLRPHRFLGRLPA